MTDFSRLWMFSCGSPANYVIEAGDEREAMAVATAYCRSKGIRPPAVVRPFIVATPEILGLPMTPTHEGASAVAATSGVNESPSLIDRAKAVIGR